MSTGVSTPITELFNNNNNNNNNYNNRHKLRHSRKFLRRSQISRPFLDLERSQHTPAGRIEMSIIPPPPPQKTPFFMQTSQMTRPQRSPSNEKNFKQQQQQRQQRKRFCQEKDVMRNAYIANTVVLARAESMSSNRVSNYSVTFRILKKFKSKYRLDDTLRLTFLNENKRMQCEPDPHGFDGKTRGLVKAKIQQSKEYYLFLNSDGMHRYTVQGIPVLKRKKLKGRKDFVEVAIRKIADSKFGESLRFISE